MTIPGPFLSVVVPASDCAEMLEACLTALRASDLPRYRLELIVVDDGSRDETGAVALRYADAVITLEGAPRGPAYSRNRGVDLARGEVIVFVNADVSVHPEALRYIWNQFRDPRAPAAVIGSYDDAPPARNLVSRYRNLMLHAIHRRHPGEAVTFWSGLGAVRSTIIRQVGMFNEWDFPRQGVEDVELGLRLRSAGHRIELHPELQATHRKTWTLTEAVATDLHERGVPMVRLLVQRMGGKVIRHDRVFVAKIVKLALVGLAAVALPAALWHPAALLVSCGAALAVLVLDFPIFLCFARREGIGFALLTIPLHFLSYLLNGLAVVWGWMLHIALGEPQPRPAVQALQELGVESWPPVPRKPPAGPAAPRRRPSPVRRQAIGGGETT